MADYNALYSDKLQAIYNYYGEGTTIWEKIQLGTATNDEINFALSRIPQLQIDQTANGTVLGYSYADPVYMETYKNPILENVNSNYAGGQYGNGNALTPRFNGNFGYDAERGQYYIETGAKTGAGATLATIADRASLGVTAANIGAKLGKQIDELIYNIDPEWWDNHYPNINPETWTSIAGSEGGKNFVRTLFGIRDGGMTAYVQSEMIAQTYQMLRDLGIFDGHAKLEPGTIQTGENIKLNFITGSLQQLALQIFGAPLSDENIARYGNHDAIVCLGDYGNDVFIATPYSGTLTYLDEYTVSPDPYGSGNVYKINHDISGEGIRGWRLNTRTGKVAWQISSSSHIEYISNGSNGTSGTVAYVGDFVPLAMTNISGATQYPPTNITGTDLDTVLQQLKNTYPDLFTDSIYETVKQPDGSLKTYEYVPVPWCTPNTQNTPQPTTGTTQQTDTEIAPQTGDKLLDDSPMLPPVEKYPDTGTGDAPEPVLPTGNASSLWSVYNPTQSEVNAFGSWLWSSDFVEQLKKMFNDPMQAIIGIHKVFATPNTGARANIKCGYIDSGVSALTVTSQYTEVDCGTVSLLEYFGNVFDYQPYTSVRVFLPFIGIVSLNVADVMRSSISIKYKVDVFTGACIAEISVKRDAHKSVIYTFTGSAIVSYPLSSGTYAGVISAAIGVATSLMRGSVVGAVASAASAHADTETTGSFSGAAGAMGGKKPYLIISRPISKLADGENTFDGYPSGEINLIGNCEGFIKCFDVHLRIDTATDKELEEIRALLLSGVRLTSANDGGEIIEPDYVNIQPLYVTENGTYTGNDAIDGYSPVQVNIPPYSTPAEAGKVVDSNGELINQTAITVTENGVIDTTFNNEVTVRVSGSGFDIPNGAIVFAQYLNVNFVMNVNPTTFDFTINPIEYAGNVWGNSAMINTCGMVLIGNFSQGGNAQDNVLTDSLNNYSAIVLQGIYYKNPTSGYNTSMMYAPIQLNNRYWAGMKDRNSSYDCFVTFTDDTHCNLSGNRQVLIYGIP